jgi:hypothetical protein
MRAKTTIQLLVLACLLGLTIWFMRARGLTHPEGEGGKLVHIVVDEISRLTIEHGEMAVTCERRSDGWFILSPIKARACVSHIDELLNAIAGLPRGEVITADQMTRRGLTLDDYTLGSRPRVRLKLEGAKRTTELLFGRDTPLDEFVYAKLASAEEIVVTSTNILAVIPSTVEQLRERKILHGDIARVSRLEIEHADGGFIRIEKQHGQWVMGQPVKNARLNGRTILALLRRLYELHAKGFVPAAEGVVVDDKQALIRVAVWLGGDDASQRLLLSGPTIEGGDLAHARLAGSEHVCVVDGEIVKALQVKANDLRERTLFAVAPGDIKFVKLNEGERTLALQRSISDGWAIVEPTHWKASDELVAELLARVTALEVSEFIDGGETNLAAFGLAEPDRGIRVATTLPPGPAADGGDSDDVADKAGRELFIGGFTPKGHYAKFSDESSVLLIAGELLPDILAGSYDGVPGGNGSDVSVAGRQPWINPLVYSDRVMLRLPPASVVSVSLAKYGREQVVRRADADWQAVAPSTGVVARTVVLDALEIISSLQAVRVEYQEHRDLAAYGLDEPDITLAFGLREGEGIAKTLAIGFRAKTDGVYAMIRGQDVVFVLPRAVALKLTRNLVVRKNHAG